MSKQSSTEKITLAHGTVIAGKFHNAGSSVTLDRGEAQALRAAGYVDDGDAGTVVDAAATASGVE